MFIESILNDPENSTLVVTDGERADVVIAAPHHAPLGAGGLQSAEHPAADENAGLLAYRVSRLLDCPCVIACNYFIDANKDEGSNYSKRIVLLAPRVLVEIHGHGGGSARFDIEISSGSAARNGWSWELAERLRAGMAALPLLRGYSLSGDFASIYFKATKSWTITTGKWIPFHIELPRSIREEERRYAPFCEVLAETLSGMLGDFEELDMRGTNTLNTKEHQG